MTIAMTMTMTMTMTMAMTMAMAMAMTMAMVMAMALIKTCKKKEVVGFAQCPRWFLTYRSLAPPDQFQFEKR